MSAAIACLILVMADNTLLPLSPPFPDTATCEIASSELSGGPTVKDHICVPVAIYDCSKPAPPIPKRQRRME